jgi:hypothetical protein
LDDGCLVVSTRGRPRDTSGSHTCRKVCHVIREEYHDSQRFLRLSRQGPECRGSRWEFHLVRQGQQGQQCRELDYSASFAIASFCVFDFRQYKRVRLSRPFDRCLERLVDRHSTRSSSLLLHEQYL